MNYRCYRGTAFSLLICVTAFALIDPAYAGGGKALGKLLRDAVNPSASIRNTDPRVIRRVLENEYGKSPFGVGPILRYGKIPNHDLKIVDLRIDQSIRALDSIEFNSELRLAIKNALPAEIKIDRISEDYIFDIVSNAVKPAILKVLEKRPDITRKILENQDSLVEISYISDDLVNALSVTPKEKDVLTRITASGSGVHFEFVKGIRIGRAEIKLGKIEMIKPTVVAAFVAWCVDNHEGCSDSLGEFIARFYETEARELTDNASDPVDRIDGGMGGLDNLLQQ